MRGVDILVVDDSAADRASIRIAFERTGHPVKLHFAHNGQMALDFLRADHGAAMVVRPQLCVLDVKMPGLSGLHVLQALKADTNLVEIPVIMLSGSDDQSDIRAAYRLFASGYIKKPTDAEGLHEVADVLGRLCTGILAFPTR